MKHLNEEELILLYYGERAGSGAGGHLETCDVCQASFRSMALVLDAMDGLPVPERGAEYGSRVWQQLAPQLEKERVPWWKNLAGWLEPRRMAVAGAMAALLIAAFLAGRVSTRTQPVAGLSGSVRERIMLVAVGEHLDQSQMVLVELMNNSATGPVDITEEQQRAGDLISENRLYRQAALKSGDGRVSNVLDELQRVLLDIVHSPSKLDSAEFQQIRQRIESEGILFKIRVVGSNLREREKAPLTGTKQL